MASRVAHHPHRPRGEGGRREGGGREGRKEGSHGWPPPPPPCVVVTLMS